MIFRTFLENVPDSFLEHDLSGRIIDVNRTACANLGYSREELLSMAIADIDPDYDREGPYSRRSDASLVPGRFKCRDGTVFPVEIHVGSYGDGVAGTVLILAHDTANRRLAESRQDRLSKLYRALSEVNQAIVRMEDEATLLPLVCRMAVDFGGMKMAWIGQLNPSNGLIEPVVCHGSGTDYLKGISISSSAELPEGRGPSGMAYRENRPVIVNDFRMSELTRPWQKNASLFGFESCGSFPVFRAGKPFAVFTVYHECREAFDEEIIALLDELARDVSFALDNFDREKARRQDQEILRVSEEKFSKTFHNSPNPTSISRLDDGKIVEVNEAWMRITGYDREEAIGRTAYELGVWREPGDRLEVVNELKKLGRMDGREFVFRSKEGNDVICLVSAEVVDIGHEACLILIAQDITGLKSAMETIREQNNFLNAIFESEPHCVKVVGLDGTLIQMNKAGLAMLELDSLEEARKIGLLEFISPEYRKLFVEFHKSICSGSSGKLEFPVTGASGTKRWLESHATPLKDVQGRIVALLGVTRDVTEKKRSDELIWKQANFDLLTELPNRYMFYDRLEQEIKRAHFDNEGLAIFFIDLDQFKEVNDTLGHQAGDALLMESARRIAGCVREADTVARLGGDEFTVILSQHDMMHIEKIAQDILDSLSGPFMLGEDQVYVSASMGITLYPSDASDVEQLLKNADQAMYAAKNAGRNRFSYFTSSLQEKAQSRLRLLNDLRKGVGAEQFVLYFQPIMELSSNSIVKAEALLRWQHPERGLVGPMEFIPLAEETGLILPIGNWVFREASKRASIWAKKYPDVQISVNMSPLQFQNAAENIGVWIERLRELGLSGRNMAIEITESLLLDADIAVTETLFAFRDAGIQVAIDDFGTGYSSLSYLKKFDIDYLKIDRSFVRNLATDPSDMALCEAIIVMAHKLGLKVIAEGVETVIQRDLLLRAGCDYAQGYLYSPPVPAEEFGAFLRS